MAEQKTQESSISIDDFLNQLPEQGKRRDSELIIQLMKDITGFEPKIWGANMVGFGRYRYKYASGHEGEYFQIGFAPGKSKFSIYLMCGADVYPEILAHLGKYKIGKSCLYINKLADVNTDVLKELIKASFDAGPKIC